MAAFELKVKVPAHDPRPSPKAMKGYTTWLARSDEKEGADKSPFYPQTA